jgi:hypothetical protein
MWQAHTPAAIISTPPAMDLVVRDCNALEDAITEAQKERDALRDALRSVLNGLDESTYRMESGWLVPRCEDARVITATEYDKARALLGGKETK